MIGPNKKGALSEFLFGASPSQVSQKEPTKEFQRLEEKAQTLKQKLNTFEIDKKENQIDSQTDIKHP